MQNQTKLQPEEAKVLKVKISKGKQEPATLFTAKDVRRTVKDFVTAWIQGDIVIRFPTAAELSKKNPLAITSIADPSISEELKIKEHYVDLLSICAGIKKASVEEQEKAVVEVYRMMLMFRSANRIEGKITSSDLEKRVVNMEERLAATQRIVEQLVGVLVQQKKP